MGRPQLPRIELPLDTLWKCRVCKQEKPLPHFIRKSQSRLGYIRLCRACHSKKESKRKKTPEYRTKKNARQRQLYHTSKDVRDKILLRSKVCRRKHHLKLRFGLTPHDVADMVESQCNCCAICNDPFVKTPNIDHDHGTGKIRGLLCGKCNVGLGQFEDNPTLLQSAIEYLLINS